MPIFVVGAQRSGTTLLRLMLNAHSEIAIPEEGTFWMPLLRKYGRKLRTSITGLELERCFRYIESNTQFKLWGIEPNEVFADIRRGEGCSVGELMSKLYQYYAESCNKIVWGDKTPSFFRMISVLRDLFPDARFIHVVRDGRDVYLSWRKMDSSKSNVCVTALEWKYKVKRARKELRAVAPKRVFEIRYEDLVARTEEELERICLFLGLEYEADMLNYWQTSQNFIGCHHSKLIFRPVTLVSVNKWQTELTERELGSFEWIAGAALESLGYRLAQEQRDNPRTAASAMCRLLCGLPLRAAQVFYTALVLNIAARFGLATKAAGSGST